MKLITLFLLMLIATIGSVNVYGASDDTNKDDTNKDDTNKDNTNKDDTNKQDNKDVKDEPTKNPDEIKDPDKPDETKNPEETPPDPEIRKTLHLKLHQNQLVIKMKS